MSEVSWSNEAVVRVFPQHYIYVRDLTTNVTRLEVGPQTFVRKDNEQVTDEPLKMVRSICSAPRPHLNREKIESNSRVLGIQGCPASAPNKKFDTSPLLIGL